ncbi:hypothetical protein KKH23_05830 [Patescibacteria group bacterium]|nr:hypothetical protein [Patescibacteria group bacterium]
MAYACPWACNCRLEDSLTNRLRGGSWTGIAAGARPSEILYRDRILTFSGNAITATRQGDHTDTTLSADVSDALRPALFQLSEAGEVGEDVVALIPHKDMHLLGFAAGETWIQQGDPYTGTRHCVSREVGIIGADAWCVNHDTVYFLSSHGLYSVGADGSGLKPLSEDKIPEDLTDADDDDCTLTYNHPDRGVYIHLTAGVSWFYDTARDQFWPFDTDSTDSHLLIGPVRLGGPDRYGMIQQIHGIMAASSDTVVWRLVPGNTAEEACDNGKAAITAALAGEDYDEYTSSSGAWDAGRSPTGWPRATSMWACVWLSSDGDWAFESVHLTVSPFGSWRG